MTTEETRVQIEDMVKTMRFERKKNVTKQQKTIYADLKKNTDDAMHDMSKLNLRLWHAINKKDYHSLTLDEAEHILQKIRQNIDNILDLLPSEKKER